MGLPVADADKTDDLAPPTRLSGIYPWVVFVLTFALMLSDYMSRQVVSAVFPILKSEWDLSDANLGSLTGVVALMVGMLTFPLSVAADRWGRVRMLVASAALWSVATLFCAFAGSYSQLLVGRFFVGVGEAAYGSIGAAVVVGLFAPHLRASLTGAFMSGGMFGSVAGVALGGVIAVNFGWRWAFGAMAIIGLVLVVAFRSCVSERRLALYQHPDDGVQTPSDAGDVRVPLSSLFKGTSVISAYIGSGLQMFVGGALMTWLPSYVNRYYDLPPDKAALMASAFVLMIGVGMIGCGMISDRVSRVDHSNRWTASIAFCLASAVLLLAAFSFEPGALQLILLGCGAFFAAGIAGPAGAMVANLTHASVRASAFGTVTLANSLIGLAPGPVVAGALADRVGLNGALQIVPIASVFAAIALIIGKRYYAAGLKRLTALTQNSIDDQKVSTR
ncbi:MFS transporter [Rhodococcus sp. TAF43]|uniref:MFS transporter n=1 Tax=Rhodococcus sp. TAF43 TaxID=3237483 RepID=UPI003F9BB5C9